MKNPGTITRIKTNKNGVFEMLFVAIGVSIRSFVQNLRPLLVVDGAHLKGLYKGTNLLAVGMDENNQIVPVAYGICRGETGDCWSWWFSVLKECIADREDLVIISDRHPAIALAIRNEYPLAFHGICCRHLMMNLSLKKKTKGLYWSICKAYTPEEFERKMQILQAIQPEAYNKLIEADVQRWSRAHSPHTRYNYCTSNSVESTNACTVKSRTLPITMLTEQYRKMVQDWYFKRREVAAKMKYDITDWAAHKVKKRKIKSATWNVYGINQDRFQVYDGRYNREVNLATKSCDCRKWQLSGIPCGHVMSVTRFLGLTDCVQFVQDWFKKLKYQATYAESVNFVREFHEWEYPPHIQPIIPPRMDNPQPGRPKNTNRIPSQGEEPQVKQCGRCGQAGHKSYQCKKKKTVDEQHEGPHTFDAYPTETHHHNFPTNDTHQSQVFEHNTYKPQPYEQGEASHEQNALYNPSHGYELYDSQPYASQHLNDQNTQESSNSWFNFFGLKQVSYYFPVIVVNV